jgi:hypothetical protein
MSGVPSRRHWRAEFAQGPALVYTEMCQAFGWRVVRHYMPRTAALRVRSSGTVPRHLAPNKTYFVSGRISAVLDDGTRIPDRTPGMYSGERPDSLPGVLTMTALEDSEFWCFNYTANRRALPELVPLRYPDGGVFLGQEGDRILVCAGGLGRHEPGDSFRVGGDELVAAPGTYALVIGADRG